MIDESICNWLIETVDVALTRKNGTIFTTADLNSAYNQIPLADIPLAEFAEINLIFCLNVVVIVLL